VAGGRSRGAPGLQRLRKGKKHEKELTEGNEENKEGNPKGESLAQRSARALESKPLAWGKRRRPFTSPAGWGGF